MNRLSSDAKILSMVIGALVVLAIFMTLTAPAPAIPSFSIHNAGTDGVMALQLWISASGYKTAETTSWAQLDKVDALLLLSPNTAYTEQDGRQLRDWVRQGHTLIIASSNPLSNPLLKAFNLTLIVDTDIGPVAIPGAPTLELPPFSAVQANTSAYIQSRQPAVVSHLFAGTLPILTSQDLSAGRVWLSSAIYPFTNQGLHDPGSPRLIANLLAGMPHTATIGFDENRGGLADFGGSQPGLSQWLFNTPPGVGIVLGCVLTMIFLLSHGRRFGHAVPLPTDRLRRESVEYVYAMAGLFRRSGQRIEALKHFNQRLRRHLAARYGVDPRLSPAELTNAISAADPTIDKAQIGSLLVSLSQSGVSEQELVRYSADLDHFLRNFS